MWYFLSINEDLIFINKWKLNLHLLKECITINYMCSFCFFGITRIFIIITEIYEFGWLLCKGSSVICTQCKGSSVICTQTPNQHCNQALEKSLQLLHCYLADTCNKIAEDTSTLSSSLEEYIWTWLFPLSPK